LLQKIVTLESRARFTAMNMAAKISPLEKRMTIPLALGLVLFQSFFNFGAMGALGSKVLPDPTHPFAPSLTLAFLMLLSSAVLLPVLWYFCLFRPKRSAANLGWRFENPVRIVAFGILGGLAGVTVVTAALLAIGAPPLKLLERVADRSVSQWLMFLWIGINAALTEETLFRGNLQLALETKWSPLGAALLGAVVFAIYHLNPWPISLVVKCAGGMVFWWVRQRGNSLMAPAISHVLLWVLAGDL
jgi:membrane protease YdiL (CAAX protease family)